MCAYRTSNSSNFYKFMNIFEHETSDSDDVAMLMGYGVVNGLLSKRIKGPHKGVQQTDILSVYSGLKKVMQGLEVSQVSFVLDTQQNYLDYLLKKISKENEPRHGLAQKFLSGKHDLVQKKNPVEYIRNFGNRTVYETSRSNYFPISSQNRIVDYNIIEKVLREVK